jgi:hypothetical protein
LIVRDSADCRNGFAFGLIENKPTNLPYSLQCHGAQKRTKIQTRPRSIFVTVFTTHFHPAAAPSSAPLDSINKFAERLAGLAATMPPGRRWVLGRILIF